jgi:hypothetical protein
VDELKLVKFVDEKSTSQTIKKIQQGNWLCNQSSNTSLMNI